MLWSEALATDAFLLLAAIVLIYLMYNASVKLAKQKNIPSTWLFALRTVTLGECIILIYAIVDIPWTVITLYFPDLVFLSVFKYLFIYVILSAVIVAPAVNQILRVPFAQRERDKNLLYDSRSDLLQELKIVTSKFLKKQMPEKVFVDISSDLEIKIASIEAKLEKLRIATEPDMFKELFKP
ncbi:MAG: hypothetical protein NTY90_00915 [Candidatus Micrarchaeota archaeon]|nr:hypothetical protein [Candidatus Micrarchaeota archaeon]